MIFKTSRGFTLLETLIAMMIIVGAILIVTNSWSGNFMRLRKSALLQEVSHLIEKKMTELDVEYRDKVAEIPETANGDFGSDYKNYRWEMKSRDLELPDLGSIIAGQSGGSVDELSLMIVRQMSEFFKSAVKELTLTVFAKSTKRETPYSVTTYMIDYDVEMNGMPGGGGGGGTAPAAGGAGGGGSPSTTPATGGSR